MAEKLSELLKKWRGVKGLGRNARGAKLSQAEAALRLGVSVRTYESWEHGRHEPQGLAREVVLAKITRQGRSRLAKE